MEKRNEYIQKLEEKLAAYNTQLAELKAKSTEVQLDRNLEYISRVEALEKKRDDFVGKCGQLKESNGHAWDDVKIGTEKAWNEFEDSIEQANAHFK